MKSLIAQYFLNHRLDVEEIRWQMEQFAEQGYHGVYAHARAGMLTPYFSEEWWQAVDAIVEACERLGLEFWIWDEDYYPSGLCGGRVVWSDPGLQARELVFATTEAEGGRIEVDFAQGMLLRAYAIEVRDDGTYGGWTDVTAHCGTRRQQWGRPFLKHGAYSPLINLVGHPHQRASIQENRFALVWEPEQPGRYLICAGLVHNTGRNHPDLLRPEGIASFIELSYEPYAERYPDRLGSIIKGSFTDEPSPGTGGFPWSPGFPAEFTADHGYDILDHLPHLAVNIDDRSPLVRHHYRLTQHRLVKANYVEQVGEWCRARGMQFSGHLTRTEWLSLVAAWWPNELRCYEPMDIPCTDPLGASTGFSDAAAYHTGLKVASSAAHLFGRQQAGSDCLAVMGDETSIRDLRYQLDYQMALGINFFCVHGLSYSLDGRRKDEVPPSIFYQHTQWRQMGTLMEHVSETAEKLTGGRHICEIAIVYPSTTLGCQIRPDTDWHLVPDEPAIHELSELLLSHHDDFDFIDEVAVQEIDAKGALNTPEAYSVIVLPHLRYIDAATADGLLRFADAGGRVIAIGTMPQAITRDLTRPLTEWADERIEFVENLGPEMLATLPGVGVLGDGASDVFVLRRERDGERISFAFNRREQEFIGQVDGTEIVIPPREGILIENGQPPEHIPAPGADALDISSGWEVEFEDNQLPLNFWHASATEPRPSATFVSLPGFDLMEREPDPLGEGDGPAVYWCRFMLTGQIPDARIVIEDSTITGDWKVSVNDIAIDDWERVVEFDCRNLHAPVGHALRGGSTPTLNVLRIETSGPGRGLHEVAYLYGSFTCGYRYGHLSYPFVEGRPGLINLRSLQPWSAIGYPTFSGAAVYRTQIEIAQTGDYVLDLGRVADCAGVSLDGVEVAVLPWPPYRCILPAVSAGMHELAIDVCNPPANRSRASGLVAGLLGPVRVGRG